MVRNNKNQRRNNVRRPQQQQAQQRKQQVRPKGPELMLGRRLRSLEIRSPAYELGCSLDRPFDCVSCIPDGARGTGCFSMRNQTSLTTGAGGNYAYYALRPTGAYQVSSITGATTAFPFAAANAWSQLPGASTANSLYQNYRPISAGVRVTYTGPTQTDGGMILAALVDQSIPIASFAASSLTQITALCNEYKCYPLRNGCEITWRPSSEVEMADWTNEGDNTTSVTGVSTTTWMFILITGAAASQSLVNIEAIVNMEGRTTDNTFIAGGINSGKLNKIEVGWYEKVMAMADKVEAIRPVVLAGVTGYATGGLSGAALGVLGSLGNGLPAPGQLASSRRVPVYR